MTVVGSYQRGEWQGSFAKEILDVTSTSEVRDSRLHEPVTEPQKRTTMFELDIELLRGIRMSQCAQLLLKEKAVGVSLARAAVGRAITDQAVECTGAKLTRLVC